MINRLILAVVGSILLALALRGTQGARGYLADVQGAAQARSVAYQSFQK
jgi:hypothetical protein